MPRFSHGIALGFAFAGLAACGAAPLPAPSKAVNAAVPREQLDRIVDRYWDERDSSGYAVSQQALADSRAIERRYLGEISALPRAGLDPASRLTYDIFKRQRELAVEGFTYPAELLAADPFDGMPPRLARMAADTAQPPPAGSKDYEEWLRRIDDYALWTRQAMDNMREGIRRGYTSPRPLIERSLPFLERCGEDRPDNVFYTRLGPALSGPVRDRLLPAYRRLHDFLAQEYLPRARTTLALTALPLGELWYAYRVRLATGTALSVNEIHHLGLAEVDRIRASMSISANPVALAAAPVPAPRLARASSSETAPSSMRPALAAPAASSAPAASPGPAQPPGPGAPTSIFLDLQAQTLAAMPALFSAAPPSDFEIQTAVLGGETTPLSYRPAGPGTVRPAVLYVDAAAVSGRTAAALTAMFLQEAIPGLHYQAAIQHARTDLPRFRRWGRDAAFVEGWGLYAASLGEELGLYRGDEARAGALSAQMRCAAALVVDTGLHAKGWTRSQALDYLRSRSGLDDAGANLLVDRFAAAPGDALACKMGELKFQALRAQAQQSLGGRFDIRDFHAEILDGGAMPLDILEARVKLWIESRR